MVKTSYLMSKLWMSSQETRLFVCQLLFLAKVGKLCKVLLIHAHKNNHWGWETENYKLTSRSWWQTSCTKSASGPASACDEDACTNALTECWLDIEVGSPCKLLPWSEDRRMSRHLIIIYKRTADACHVRPTLHFTNQETCWFRGALDNLPMGHRTLMRV